MSTHCDDGLPIEVWRRVAACFSVHPPQWPRRKRSPRAERIRRLLGLPEPEAVYWAPEADHPLEKVCSKCGAEKHLMEFYLRYKLGRRRPDCRACCLARMRRYRRRNLEAVRARRRRRYWRHREEIRAKRRERSPAQVERERAQQRRWSKANRERLRELGRRYRERHPRRFLVRRATQLLRKLGLIVLAEHCQDCGAKATEHHHLNYEDPYAVVSLCRSCHLARHHGSWRPRGHPQSEFACGTPAEGGEERRGDGVAEHPQSNYVFSEARDAPAGHSERSRGIWPETGQPSLQRIALRARFLGSGRPTAASARNDSFLSPLAHTTLNT